MTATSEILTADEVSDITGRKTFGKQIEWLRHRGWIFEINAAGRPIVGRYYLRAKLGGNTPTASDMRVKGKAPNFAALRRGV